MEPCRKRGIGKPTVYGRLREIEVDDIDLAVVEIRGVYTKMADAIAGHRQTLVHRAVGGGELDGCAGPPRPRGDPAVLGRP